MIGSNFSYFHVKYIQAKHNLNAEYIAKTFSLSYFFCDNQITLNKALKEIYNYNFDEASLLEVSTENELNPEILKRYFRRLRNVQ